MQPNRSPHGARADAGFTLVEIMVVVVILGLLATLVVPNVLSSAAEAREEKAFTDCNAIHSAAVQYSLRNRGKVPTIEDLTTPDDTGNAYIEMEIEDPWGNEYVLRPLEARGKFEVISMGEDQMEDTEDDIRYPKPTEDR